MRGGRQAAGHRLVLGPLGGHGCSGGKGTRPKRSPWAEPGAAPWTLDMSRVRGGRESLGCFCFALGQEGKEGSLQPPCLSASLGSPSLPGAVGNLMSEILQINIDGPGFRNAPCN